MRATEPVKPPVGVRLRIAVFPALAPGLTVMLPLPAKVKPAGVGAVTAEAVPWAGGRGGAVKRVVGHGSRSRICDGHGLCIAGDGG